MTRIASAIILSAMLAAMVGCSNSVGPSESDALDSYWIGGHYTFQFWPLGERALVWPAAVVHVLSGGADGVPVTGLEVTCNDQALLFNGSWYSLESLWIPTGSEVSFRVSDGADSLTLTLEVPGCPRRLDLVEGAWDFSDPAGSHTLTWENPSVVADSVLVHVVGLGTHPLDLHVHIVGLPASATEVTLSNAELADFETVTRIECAVSQGVRGFFVGHSGGSEMWARAAMIRTWPPQQVCQIPACLPN